MSDKGNGGIVEKAGKATVKALVVGASSVAGTVAGGPLGGVAASTGMTFVVESIQEYLLARTNAFSEEVGDRLVELEQAGALSLTELAKDEQFITTLTNALRIAGQTHHKEKREALKNAVLNAAITRDSKIEMLITLLQQMTPLHIVALRMVKKEAPVAGMQKGFLQDKRDKVLRELLQQKVTKEEVETLLPPILATLESQGLIDRQVRREEGATVFSERIYVTELGKLFLKYIYEPEVEKGPDDQG